MVLPMIEEDGVAQFVQPRQQLQSTGTRTLAHDLMPQESPGSADSIKRVVIVMDGLKEFTMEPLEWVLNNIAVEAACSITLVGVMPWLNIPLSSKTWSDIWTVNFEDLATVMERADWKCDIKYQKVQQMVELCRHYGVRPQMKSEMGYPLQLIAVEQIIGLHATLVVFDRHHQKYREYYAERIPCNMVMMNEEGEVDMIKSRSSFMEENINGDQSITTPTAAGESPALSATLLLAEHLKRFFKHKP